MKLILKADDYGYTKTFNEGVIHAIENGLVTTVDVMLDTPGAIDGLERIRDYPWISVSWHSNHLFGRPSVDPSLVPSMVNADGRFKFRIDENEQRTVSYDDARRDFTAQVEKCLKYLGRVPDCVKVRINDWPLERAKADVCKEFGIPVNVYAHFTGVAYDRKSARKTVWEPADPRWVDRNIVQTKLKGCPGGHDYELELYKDHYKPEIWIQQMDVDSFQDAAVVKCCHPGWVDDYILQESSCHVARARDCQSMCSQELHDWVKEKKIELVSITDAMYGRRDYQNHLKVTGSDLYIPAM